MKIIPLSLKVWLQESNEGCLVPKTASETRPKFFIKGRTLLKTPLSYCFVHTYNKKVAKVPFQLRLMRNIHFIHFFHFLPLKFFRFLCLTTSNLLATSTCWTFLERKNSFLSTDTKILKIG